MLRVAFAARHTGEFGDLRLHDRLGQDAHALTQEVDVAVGDRLAHRLEYGHPVLGHRCLISLASSVHTPTTRG